MTEFKVKGEVFQTILELVADRWGADSIGKIGAKNGVYNTDQWYPFEEFSQLLSIVKSSVGNNNPLVIYQLGLNTMKREQRWNELFSALDPADVFQSTERQDTEYRVGTYTAVPKSPKHIQVTMECDDPSPEWCEFYRGRLQGVLELTGRTGVVHLLPARENKLVRTYDIKWG